jgi:hypothetical protein
VNFVQSSGTLFNRNIQGGWSHTNSTKYALSYPNTYTATAQQGQMYPTVSVSVLRNGHMCHQASWHALGDLIYSGELQQPNTINIYRHNVNTNIGQLNTLHSFALPAIYYIRTDTVISFIFPLILVQLVKKKSYKFWFKYSETTHCPGCFIKSTKLWFKN